jgi:hypothetical protein
MLVVLWMITVTGLHDMDEFVQSQLILAVSSYWFLCLHPVQMSTFFYQQIAIFIGWISDKY